MTTFRIFTDLADKVTKSLTELFSEKIEDTGYDICKHSSDEVISKYPMTRMF